MDELENRTFGELLRGFRRRKNLNQDGLAYKLGKKTRSSIDTWERGLYLPETPETVLAIAEALSLSEYETDALLLAARYAPKYGVGNSRTEDDNTSLTRSSLEELKKYLDHAISAYEAYMYQAVLRIPSTAAHPYKFLDAFGLQDSPIFCGRGTATEELYKKVLSDRLTILHAKSGAGKTSLLHAGLSPRFIREGRLPLYVHGYGDPVLAIKRLIVPARLGPWPKLLHELSFYEFMGLVCDSLSRQTQELIVIFDQFEQFFLLRPQLETRGLFIRALGDCYDDQRLPLRFIIALRKDYYSDLDDFNQILPHLNVFQNQYRLKDMTHLEVQEAITGPLARLGISVRYEPSLLETLLAGLVRPDIELPLLQIICTRLYETRDLAETQITLKIYQALGQAEGVLSHYLNDVLANLPDNEKTLAKSVLKALVRSDSLKQILNDRTLAARIDVQRNKLDRVLARLVDARLLRRDEVTAEILYELAHEYLITEIVKWFDLADLEIKQAEELLQRELINWSMHHMLIPKSRLEVLYTHRKQFKGLEEWKCLLISALAEDFAVADWVKAAGDIGELLLFQIFNVLEAEVRQRGVKALGELGTIRAVETLIEVLKDEDASVRTNAVEVLGALKDSRAINPLIATLKDEDELVRASAVDALGAFKDYRAVDPLLDALKDKDASVQRNAVKALSDSIKVLNPLKYPRAVEMLIEVLKDEDASVRINAVEVLGALKDSRAINPLIATLKDEDGLVRASAVEALRAFKDPRAVDPLIEVLKDEYQGLRINAVEMLGALKDSRAINPLIATLKDEDELVRASAVEALGAFKDPQLLKIFIDALKDESWVVCWYAAEALVYYKDPRSLEPLLDALKRNDRYIKWRVSEVLGEIGDPRAIEPLIAILKDENSDFPPRAAIFLPAGVKDGELGGRWRSAEALGKIGDIRAIDHLITKLKDKNNMVRYHSAEALGKIGDSRAVEHLIVKLKDDDRLMQLRASSALECIGTPEALTALKNAGKER